MRGSDNIHSGQVPLIKITMVGIMGLSLPRDARAALGSRTQTEKVNE